MAFEGTLIADKYRVDALVGETSFGSLYRGTNTLLERPVAIVSAVPDGDNERFFDAARSAAKISHPNVLALQDFGTDAAGIAFAVHEAPHGEQLSEAIGREGRLTHDFAVDIARQTASSLSAADRLNLIHGTLSPESILVATNDFGRPGVKVFGFRPAVESNSPHRFAADHDAKHLAYLAPELLVGLAEPDRRTDVYALGSVLYEMLAGSPPVTGDTVDEVLERRSQGPPPPLSSFTQDLPAWIEPVILKAIAEDPELRYQTADEFASDLSAGAIEPAAATATIAPTNNNAWKTAFVVLAGISLMTVVLIYMTYSRQTDPTTALQPDANGMPVQPINPATGVEEQNLANLPPDYTMLNTNANTGMVDPVPGGDGYNPWANGGAPPPGAPALPPGGRIIQVPPGQSPFMMDPNCILQPSGIYLCPVPITPTPTPRVTPSPRTTPSVNPDTVPTPAATPQGTRPPATPSSRPATSASPGPNSSESDAGEDSISSSLL